MTPQYSGGLAIGIDLVTLTHDGQSTFIVSSIQNDQSEQLTSAIGAYKGQRPLVVEGPLSFQVVWRMPSPRANRRGRLHR